MTPMASERARVALRAISRAVLRSMFEPPPGWRRGATIRPAGMVLVRGGGPRAERGAQAPRTGRARRGAS